MDRDASLLRDAFFAGLGLLAAAGLGVAIGHILWKAWPHLNLPVSVHIVVTRPVPDYIPNGAA